MRRLKGVTKVTGKEVDKPVSTADSDTPNKDCHGNRLVCYLNMKYLKTLKS